MKKLMLLVLAAIIGVSVIPGTAGAGRRTPIRGSVDVQFNMGVIFGVGVADNPDTNVSYIGDITFGRHDYTLVWFNVTPPAEGCTWCYAEEYWRIYDSAQFEFGVVNVPPFGDIPGVLTRVHPG